MAPDENEKGNRAILTAREEEILRREADVSDNYYYRVVSGVRGKIKRLDHDLEVLDENHPKLANELRETVCDRETSHG